MKILENEAFKLDEDIVKIKLHAETREDIFKELGGNLIEKGYVKSEYINALKAREEEFPTGILAVNDIGVAIPHTDASYVNDSAMAVAVLENNVSFELMGCDDGLVDVGIVFMLAINTPHGHLELLQKLMGILQKEDVLTNIKNSTEASEIIEIMSRELS